METRVRVPRPIPLVWRKDTPSLTVASLIYVEEGVSRGKRGGHGKDRGPHKRATSHTSDMGAGVLRTVGRGHRELSWKRNGSWRGPGHRAGGGGWGARVQMVHSEPQCPTWINRSTVARNFPALSVAPRVVRRLRTENKAGLTLL